MKDRLHEALQQMHGHRAVLEAKKRCAMCVMGKERINAELVNLDRHIEQVEKELRDE